MKKMTPDMRDVGVQLRQAIRDNKGRTGRTHRHLSLALGREGNYISSYLRTSASDWAIPKHPTYQALLNELGTSEAILRQAAEDCRKNAAGATNA